MTTSRLPPNAPLRFTCCANHSCAQQRSAGERREPRWAKKKKSHFGKIGFLSPPQKNTSPPTPPNNRTTYNASQTKQSSQTLRSDTLHFPECYRTGSILDRQVCSCFSRKIKPKRKNKYVNVCRIQIFFSILFLCFQFGAGVSVEGGLCCRRAAL